MKKLLSCLVVLAMLVSFAAVGTAEDQPTAISVAGYMFGPIDADKDVVTPAVQAALNEKGLNVQIEPVYIEYSEYSDILNPRLAAGTAPDVFLAMSDTMLASYYDQGAIASWDRSFFEENAPDVVAFVNGGGVNGDLLNEVDKWWAASMKDGKMVVVPSLKPDGSMPYKTLVMRGDWLDALGVTEETLPKTVDEFVDLMYRFTNEDPDGDGEADTYGMSATGVKALFGAYGVYCGFIGGTSYWYEKDGEILNPDVSDAAKEVVTILAKMYSDGVIDPEFVTGSESVAGSYWAISNGLVNARFGASALASIDHFRLKEVLNDNGGPVAQEYWAVNGDDATFVYAPWPAGPDGDYGYCVGEAVAVSESAVYNAALNDDPDKLAKIFQIMNAFAADDDLWTLAAYGIEGEHYTVNEDGRLVRNGDMTNADFNAVGIWGCRSLYGADRAFSEYCYNQLFYNDPSIANRLNWFKKDQYNSYIQNAVTEVLPSADSLQSELDTYRDETWISMIKGEISIEDGWADYVQTYMDLGGEQLYTEANEWYAAK